jgi:hypothetical protein
LSKDCHERLSEEIIQGESFSRSFQKKHPINPIEEAAKKKDIFQK